jgi:hypothetical protein
MVRGLITVRRRPPEADKMKHNAYISFFYGGFKDFPAMAIDFKISRSNVSGSGRADAFRCFLTILIGHTRG